MLLQIFSIILLLELIIIEGSNITGTCHNNGCINRILETAVEMIKKGKNLNKKCGEENGANCILDIAVDLIEKVKGGTTERNYQAVDCEELLRAGFNKSGNYTIWPKSRVVKGKSVEVYCDMQTDGGGWTVIQRRGDFGNPEDYFYQDWSSYKSGFGKLVEEFWLGNDNIFAISNQMSYSVRFDLEAFDGEKRYALYDNFWIDDEFRNYTLHISNYTGDAGDSMAYHNNMQFSTKDVKNDISTRNCAQLFKGAWWYRKCLETNLNGLYYGKKTTQRANGVIWSQFKSDDESLKMTEIKIRSTNFNKPSNVA